MLQATSVEHFIAKRSRNALDAWADWFNSLSHLTASQVCLASNTTKAAKVIDHLIQVAMECCASGNWNSAMAIALGLNLTPVARLTKTWSKVKSEKLLVLKQISDPAKNFKNYRLRMKNTCNVPFVSLLVKDACFQAQECKTSFEQNFVYDFDRFRGIKNAEENSLKLAFQSFEDLAEPLINLQQSKKMPISNLDQNDELLALVQTPVLDEDLLYLASFKLESASNAYDKNTYKQLKAKVVS